MIGSSSLSRSKKQIVELPGKTVLTGLFSTGKDFSNFFTFLQIYFAF